MEQHSILHYILRWDAARNPCPPEVMERIRSILIMRLLL